MITNPEVARRLQGETGNTVAAPAAAMSGVPGGMGRVIKHAIAKARAALVRMPGMVKAMIYGVSTGLGQTVRTTWTASVASFRRTWNAFDAAMRVAWSLRRPLALSAAIGVSVAAGCYLAGPVIAATLNGICGGATALVGMIVTRIRRMGRSATAVCLYRLDATNFAHGPVRPAGPLGRHPAGSSARRLTPANMRNARRAIS